LLHPFPLNGPAQSLTFCPGIPQTGPDALAPGVVQWAKRWAASYAQQT